MNRSTARIGYARVSSADQNPDAQITALKAAGCTMVRTETGSGDFLENRSELQTILEFIHPGETLVITRIDRLARSMHDLQVIVATLKDKGAHLAATEQPVDTSIAAGKAFFDMLGVFAEFETNMRRERQAEGILVAKQRGACCGRPPRIRNHQNGHAERIRSSTPGHENPAIFTARLAFYLHACLQPTLQRAFKEKRKAALMSYVIDVISQNDDAEEPT